MTCLIDFDVSGNSEMSYIKKTSLVGVVEYIELIDYDLEKNVIDLKLIK